MTEFQKKVVESMPEGEAVGEYRLAMIVGLDPHRGGLVRINAAMLAAALAGKVRLVRQRDENRHWMRVRDPA